MKQAQVSTASFSARHDYLFEDLGDALASAGARHPRILSFGCAAGHEPLDLKRIIPGAVVCGCDVNAKALAEAKERCDAQGVAVFESTADTIRAHGPYDAIVCMNVLLRYPHVQGKEDISKIYPFSEFDETVSLLTNEIADGGFFVLYNSCYLMEQSSCSGAVVPMRVHRHARNGWVEKYDRSGLRLTACKGEVDGVWDSLTNWRRMIMKRLDDYPDARLFETLPYEQTRLGGLDVSVDTSTTIWQMTGRAHPAAGAA